MYTYPVPYLQFLAHFHIDHDYFECHEVLEEHWKKTDGSRNSVWVGLIQTAVFLYHYRRGNVTGAQRMAQKAVACFEHQRDALYLLGIDAGLFISTIRHSLRRMQDGCLFEPFSIPFSDENLKAEFKQIEETFQPETNNYFLAHKHKLRDRTDVIQAREAAALKKAGKVTL